MTTNTWTFVIIAAVILVGLIATRYYARQRAKREVRESTYDRAPNTTNYNMNMEEEEIEEMSPEQAEAHKEITEEGDLSSLSHRDFYELKNKTEKND